MPGALAPRRPRNSLCLRLVKSVVIFSYRKRQTLTTRRPGDPLGILDRVMASSACCRSIAPTRAVATRGRDARGSRRRDALSAPHRKLSPSRRGDARRSVTASSGSRPVVAASAPTAGAHIVWIRVGDLRVHDHPGLHAASLLPPTDRSSRCSCSTPRRLRTPPRRSRDWSTRPSANSASP